MPLRVVFVDQDSKLGGVEMTTIEAASLLDQGRFSPLVVCPEPGALVDRLNRLKVPVKIISRPRFFSITTRFHNYLVPNPLAFVATGISVLQASQRLARFFGESADLVVTKGLLAHFYGGLAAATAGIPCIWHVQEVANKSSLGGAYVKLLNLMARRLPRVIVVDAEAVGAQFADDLHSTGKVRLIYNGIDLKLFSPDGPLRLMPVSQRGSGKLMFIGQVGRIVPLKGQHVLIEAFSRLSPLHDDLHLVIAGIPLFDTDDYYIQIKQLVANLHLTEHVHFLGFCDKVDELLRAIDIFVQPSVEADSPVSILEAMATGKPVIATRVPGTVDLVSDGIDGLLVPPSDVGTLADKISLLLSQPHERLRLGMAARKRADISYDRHLFIRKFEKILEDTVDRQGNFQ